MLPKRNRLNKKQVKNVLQNHKKVSRGEGLLCYFLTNNLGYARFAFIIPAKVVKHASERVRVKRMIISMIEINVPWKKLNTDYIVRVTIAPNNSTKNAMVDFIKNNLK